MAFQKLASTTEFETQPIKKYDVKDLEITVVKHEKGYFAFEDRCPHMNSPLHLGVIKKDNIMCPMHKAEFNIITGKKEVDPKIPIPKVIKMGNLMHSVKVHDMKTYKVKIEGSDILVDI